MRFVSHSPRFGVGIVGELVHFSNYGDRIVERDAYTAEFNQNDVTEDDLHYAERCFKNELGQIRGQTVLGDEVTPTPFLDRVSVFDTDEEAAREDWEGKTFTDPRGNVWPFKDYVEDVMSKLAVNHPDFRQIIQRPAEPPWPNYLQFRGPLERLVEKLVEEGFDLREVLRFEQETGHREAVIEALQARLAQQKEEMAGMEQVPA
jgi:hypothetical protein